MPSQLIHVLQSARSRNPCSPRFSLDNGPLHVGIQRDVHFTLTRNNIVKIPLIQKHSLFTVSNDALLKTRTRVSINIHKCSPSLMLVSCCRVADNPVNPYTYCPNCAERWYIVFLSVQLLLVFPLSAPRVYMHPLS